LKHDGKGKKRGGERQLENAMIERMTVETDLEGGKRGNGGKEEGGSPITTIEKKK
jgi:hypothetical protein